MTTIIAVAMRREADIFIVPRPGRHVDVFKLLARHKISHHGWTQGFLDSEGNFLTRAEAAKLAFCAQQYKDNPPDRCQKTLCSEDLW